MRPYSKTHPLPLLLLFFLVLTHQHDTVLSQPSSTNSPYDPAEQYSKVTPSMAIIIVVLIAALFFMGFFSIYIRHCNDSSSSSSSNPLRAVAGGTLGRSRRRGLDGSVIERFPLLNYSEVKGLKIGKGALECAVCLNEFEDDETLRLIPKCDHVFHSDCIDTWLESHVTCPVCRADLSDDPGGLGESTQLDSDLEEGGGGVGVEPVESCNQTNESNNSNNDDVEVALNRDRTRGLRSGSTRGLWWFPRSHSTGHSLVQPGENTDRFTLKLPDEVRKQIMNRQLDRSRSLVVLPRERSSRRGYRTGGKNNRIEKGEPAGRSDRWVFTRNPSILTRASSFLTRASSTIIRSSSLRSPKVAANDGEGTSTCPVGPDVKDSTRPPV